MSGTLSLIGYRGLRHEKFFSILEEWEVDLLLDVRRNPYSPNPDYQKDAISAAARLYRPRYSHGPALGVPGAGRSEIPEGSPKTLGEQLASPDGLRALAKLESLLREGTNVSLMCSEPNFRDCHRVRLVDEMKSRIEDLKVEELTARGEQRLF